MCQVPTPAAYALASDTLIGVVRAWATACHSTHRRRATPLAILGGLQLWLFRLALAPPPPWPGCAPGCRPTARSPPGRWRTPAPNPLKATKTARFLDLVIERHEPLASIPLHAVAGIAATFAPLADLNPAPPAPPCAKPS